jgi:hypothetical protein
MRIGTSKLEPVSALEPVTAPQWINKYDPQNRQHFPGNYWEKPNKDKSWKYFTVTQTVLMETSVHEHLGKHINIIV